MPPLCVTPMRIRSHGVGCASGAPWPDGMWRPASNEVPAVCPGWESRIMHMPDVHWNIPQ